MPVPIAAAAAGSMTAAELAGATSASTSAASGSIASLRASFADLGGQLAALRQAEGNQQAAAEASANALNDLGEAAKGSIKALIKLPFTLRQMSLSKVKELSEFGPQLSFAQAQLELGDLRRQIQLASYLGPGMSRLAAAENRLQNSLLPWKAVGYEIGTRVAEALANSLNGIAANPQRLGWLMAPLGVIPGMIGKKVGDAVKDAMEDLKQSNAGSMPVFNWMHRLGAQRDKLDAEHRKKKIKPKK